MLVFAAKNLNIHLTVLVFTFNALHGKKDFLNIIMNALKIITKHLQKYIFLMKKLIRDLTEI